MIEDYTLEPLFDEQGRACEGGQVRLYSDRERERALLLSFANVERNKLVAAYTAELVERDPADVRITLREEMPYRAAIHHAAALDTAPSEHEDDEDGYEPECPPLDASDPTFEDCAACDAAVEDVVADATLAALLIVKQQLREARA